MSHALQLSFKVPKLYGQFRDTSVFVPRRKTIVKTKSMGAIDIHFHGAFGIDLMSAPPAQLDDLSQRLAQQGVAAFCATTLSVPFPLLRESVQRLGAWIQSDRPSKQTGAVPLGIHLEGPYISPKACGAHPPDSLRPLSFDELDTLWEDSQHTLKILTTAPEELSRPQLMQLVRWAGKRHIALSLGHSHASEKQAAMAFDLGFQGVTHAWNALGFHHRTPGTMGAALGRKKVSIELILDRIHVSPTLIRWTRKLHGKAPICYVSDCAPAAATRGESWHPFGHLRVQLKDGACRLADGHLAGGGVLLPQAFAQWIQEEALFSGRPAQAILREQLPSLTTEPLRYLGLNHQAAWLRRYRSLHWTVSESGVVQPEPVCYGQKTAKL